MYSLIGKTLYEITPCKEIEKPIMYFNSRYKEQGKYIAVLFDKDINPCSFKNSIKNITSSLIEDNNVIYTKLGKIVDIESTLHYDFIISNKEKNIKFNKIYYFFILDTNKFVIIYNAISHILLNTNCIVFSEDTYSTNNYRFSPNSAKINYNTFNINLKTINIAGNCLYNIKNKEIFKLANTLFNPANTFNSNSIMSLVDNYYFKKCDKDIQEYINQKNIKMIKENFEYITF